MDLNSVFLINKENEEKVLEVTPLSNCSVSVGDMLPRVFYVDANDKNIEVYRNNIGGTVEFSSERLNGSFKIDSVNKKGEVKLVEII